MKEGDNHIRRKTGTLSILSYWVRNGSGIAAIQSIWTGGSFVHQITANVPKKVSK